MFDRSGISTDDLSWIQRDEFVHYVELAYGVSDAHDWTRFREALLAALTAAFALDADSHGGRLSPRQRRALQLLDEIRREHDPAADWPAFFDTLWSRRHAIRPDLA